MSNEYTFTLPKTYFAQLNQSDAEALAIVLRGKFTFETGGPVWLMLVEQAEAELSRRNGLAGEGDLIEAEALSVPILLTPYQAGCGIEVLAMLVAVAPSDAWRDTFTQALLAVAQVVKRFGPLTIS